MVYDPAVIMNWGSAGRQRSAYQMQAEGVDLILT